MVKYILKMLQVPDADEDVDQQERFVADVLDTELSGDDPTQNTVMVDTTWHASIKSHSCAIKSEH